MEPMSFLQETQVRTVLSSKVCEVSRFGSKVASASVPLSSEKIEAKLMSKAASPGLAALLLETGRLIAKSSFLLQLRKGKDVFVKVKELFDAFWAFEEE